MAVPTNKEELQIAIKTNYNKLKKELSGIPVELATITNLEGHAKDTVMSINNLISYLTGWGNWYLNGIPKKTTKRSSIFLSQAINGMNSENWHKNSTKITKRTIFWFYVINWTIQFTKSSH